MLSHGGNGGHLEKWLALAVSLEYWVANVLFTDLCHWKGIFFLQEEWVFELPGTQPTHRFGHQRKKIAKKNPDFSTFQVE